MVKKNFWTTLSLAVYKQTPEWWKRRERVEGADAITFQMDIEYTACVYMWTYNNSTGTALMRKLNASNNTFGVCTGAREQQQEKKNEIVNRTSEQ